MHWNERALARAAAERMKRWPRAYWTARNVYRRVDGFRSPLELPGVPGKVHRNDEMLVGTGPDQVAAYLEAGRQAADLVMQAWRATGRADTQIRSCLDLGSGYGRVTRWLAQSIPPERITACDLNREALRFLRSQFGVWVLGSAGDWADVEFDTYDLVWIGSLLTHLPPGSWSRLWGRLEQVVENGGVLVLTTRGPDGLERLDEYAPRLGRYRDALQTDLERTGMAYVRYPHYRVDYGIALHRREYVREQVTSHLGPATELFFQPGGWGGNQDVYAFHRGVLNWRAGHWPGGAVEASGPTLDACYSGGSARSTPIAKY
jgi:SAM-dependent methyltransferase